MDKNLTELVFILDRSGSMGGLESDTIGGFNSLLEKQKKVEGKCNLTTVLFDHDYELLHDRINIQAVSPLTEKDYYVRGSTALLDAVGRTISKIEHVQETTAEEYRAGKVMFVIITDGMENASREYTTKKVKSMIEAEKEKDGNSSSSARTWTPPKQLLSMASMQTTLPTTSPTEKVPG